METERSTQDWHQQKTYESMIAYGTNVIKFVLMSNGAAIISILTFLGHHPNRINDIKSALIWFIVGVVLGGFANVSAYCVQLCLFNERGQPIKAIFNHSTWLWVTIAFIIVGISCFAVGGFSAVAALQ